MNRRTPADDYPDKKTKDCCNSCLSIWCCPGRCDWFKKLFVGVVVFFALFAFIFSLYTWSIVSWNTSYKTYTSNAAIQPWPANHIIANSVALTMTLPNNLVEYMQGEYHIDCSGPVFSTHSIVITPGPMGATWDGTNRIATCSPAPLGGAGISFRVVAPNLIRIVGVRNMVFS